MGRSGARGQGLRLVERGEEATQPCRALGIYEELAGELGSWVRTAWMYATGMHVCFYKGLRSREDVEYAFRHVEDLVDAIEEIIMHEAGGRR